MFFPAHTISYNILLWDAHLLSYIFSLQYVEELVQHCDSKISNPPLSSNPSHKTQPLFSPKRGCKDKEFYTLLPNFLKHFFKKLFSAIHPPPKKHTPPIESGNKSRKHYSSIQNICKLFSEKKQYEPFRLRNKVFAAYFKRPYTGKS